MIYDFDINDIRKELKEAEDNKDRETFHRLKDLQTAYQAGQRDYIARVAESNKSNLWSSGWGIALGLAILWAATWALGHSSQSSSSTQYAPEGGGGLCSVGSDAGCN